jgi:flagellar FliL protein
MVKPETEEPEGAGATAPAARRGPLAFIAVALFLAGGGAGYGASWMLSKDALNDGEPETAGGGHGAPAAGSDAHGEGSEAGAEGDAAAVPEGSILSLGELSVNLRGSGGGRLLRVEVQVEGTATALAASEARLPQLRDAMITVASDYSWNELEGSGGKMRLHDEFLVRINGILRPERVERVYFTKFIVQ